MTEHNLRTKCTECKLILWGGSGWIECGFGKRREVKGGTEGGLMVATEQAEREKSMWGGGGGGWWDVVIARTIHHAMPAGMHWGQSCTTQLQPVLGCCAGLHYVPTTFWCLLLHLLCSSSVVLPFVFVFHCSVRLWHISISLLLNVVPTLLLSDLLNLFEQTISISGPFSLSWLLLWDLKCLRCLLQGFCFSICLHQCCTNNPLFIHIRIAATSLILVTDRLA